MLSSILGGWLGFSEKDVTLLGVAGLFHDIGKCKIDSQILNKTESLSRNEQEAVRQHAIIGYKIVQNRNIDNRVKQAVLSHHERCDGSGYPLRIKGNAIGEFPRIVAIADVYAAMTEKRPYRERSYSPFETVGYLEREGVGKFDAKYLMTFLSRVLNSYIHRRVLLSNGITGEIIFINKANFSKPLVKTSTGYLDMSLTPDVSIVEML
jgi:putative nucleotidyltransferase with HDIG domain